MAAKHVRWMQVVSPGWRINYYHSPPDEGQDFALVRTHSKARARVLAVRKWRRENRRKPGSWPYIERAANPFVGLSVEDAQEHCPECGRRWLNHTDEWDGQAWRCAQGVAVGGEETVDG